MSLNYRKKKFTKIEVDLMHRFLNFESLFLKTGNYALIYFSYNELYINLLDLERKNSAKMTNSK